MSVIVVYSVCFRGLDLPTCGGWGVFLGVFNVSLGCPVVWGHSRSAR